MAKVDTFLDSLVKYDKENIHPEVMKAIQPYLNDSEFVPDFVSTKSAAAAGIIKINLTLYINLTITMQFNDVFNVY